MSDPAPPGRQDHFAVLDGLRGVAAFVVLLLHMAQSHGPHGLPRAGLAVDFFYMLSGFVIACAYERRLSSASMSVHGFMLIRLIRLYPLLFMGVAAGILLAIISNVATGSPSLDSIALAGALALLLLPSYVFPQWSSAYPFNMAEWSLTFELFINSVYGLVAKYLSTRNVAVIVLAGFAALALLAWRRQGISGGNDQDNWGFGFIRVVFPFFCGVLLYRVRPGRRHSSMYGALINILLAFILVIDLGRHWLLDMLYVSAAFPIIIYLGSSLSCGPGVAALLLLAGRLSYPVYILHGPIIRLFAEIRSRLGASPEVALAIDAAQFLAVIAVSWFALRLFDEPVRSWLTSLSKRRQARAEAVRMGSDGEISTAAERKSSVV